MTPCVDWNCIYFGAGNRGLFVFAGILLLAAAGVFSAVHNAIG